MMLKKYKIPAILLAGLLVISACSKEEEKKDKNLDGAPAGAVLKSTAFAIDEQKLQCKLNLFIVDERGNFINNLKQEEFEIEDIFYNLTFEKNGLSKTGLSNNGPYSAGLLLDQSGSIRDTDPDDLRIEASKIFVRFLGGNDEVALYSFNEYHYYIHENFTTDSSSLFSDLDYLAANEDGSTPLYDAALGVTDHIQENANNSNQALILFTDGEDNNSYSDDNDVIENAVNKNVKIYTIGLSDQVDIELLADLADETEGAFMWAEDVKQLVSLFGNLGDLLHGSSQYYSLEFIATNPSGWYSGYTFYTNVIVSLKNGYQIKIPFKIEAR